jgi:serine/threonine-protein kinase
MVRALTPRPTVQHPARRRPPPRGRGICRLPAAVCALVALLAVAAPTRGIGAGEALDPTFGAGGVVITDFGGNDVAYAVLVQYDGRLLVAGQTERDGNYDIALARYLPDGRLDPSFGDGGRVVTDLGGGEAVYALAPLPDGRIVAAGVRGANPILLRYLPDGRLDPTFGSGGVVVEPATSDAPAAYAIAAQPDGRILVAATAGIAPVRYLADGGRDPSFAAGPSPTDGVGAIPVPLLSQSVGVAVVDEGIVLVSSVADSTLTFVQYLPDGRPDERLGPAGVATTALGGPFLRANGHAFQEDRLVVVGVAEGRYTLARYRADGEPDLTFAAGGAIAFGEEAPDIEPLAVAVTMGGIVVAGTRGGDFAVARFRAESPAPGAVAAPPAAAPMGMAAGAGVVVHTLAGTGMAGAADGPAATARFDSPRGIAVDTAGNVYVADTAGHRIRKITPDGTVSTVAGTGVPGFADGPGTTARFSSPYGLAVDAAGNVYVADWGNARVRKISPAGMVSTPAGTVPGFADGLPGTDRFQSPCGVAVDRAGNLYVADLGNYRIRKVTPAGAVSTLAGTGEKGYQDGPGAVARFHSPCGLAVDAGGTLYVADIGNAVIRTVAPDGTVSTLAGSSEPGLVDGPGRLARFAAPWGVAVDATGTVYVADYDGHTIRRVTPDGVVVTVAGTGAPGFADGAGDRALFHGPAAVAVDAAGRLFVADLVNHRVRVVTPVAP